MVFGHEENSILPRALTFVRDLFSFDVFLCYLKLILALSTMTFVEGALLIDFVCHVDCVTLVWLHESGLCRRNGLDFYMCLLQFVEDAFLKMK